MLARDKRSSLLCLLRKSKTKKKVFTIFLKQKDRFAAENHYYENHFMCSPLSRTCSLPILPGAMQAVNIDEDQRVSLTHIIRPKVSWSNMLAEYQLLPVSINEIVPKNQVYNSSFDSC